MSDDPKNLTPKLHGFANTQSQIIGPPPPRIQSYPRKPKFWVLRGTRARTLNYYWSFGLTFASCVLGGIIAYVKNDKINMFLEYLGEPTTPEERQKLEELREARRRVYMKQIGIPYPDPASDKSIREQYFESGREGGIRTSGHIGKHGIGVV